MESRRKRRRSQLYKWGLYFLLLLGGTVLQTVPGFLVAGQARPVFLLALALAVAVCEDEFSGALFGAVFEKFFKKYSKVVNAVMALLLVYCAVTMVMDIWA